MNSVFTALPCWFRLAAGGLFVCCAAFAQAQYDPQAPEPIAKLRGNLLIHGGGVVSEEVYKKFVELAGGNQAKIVLIPTASQRADDDANAAAVLEAWKLRGAASVVRLHTRSKQQADQDEFVAPLKQATAVWIGGGKQTVLADTYLGTAVERELHNLLDRGGTIGGTSAGAAVMSRLMLVRDEVRQGFDLIPGVVIDQHFLARNRQGRLMKLLNERPELVGIGVDEKTALIVRGRSLEAIGDSSVTICLAPSTRLPERIEKLTPGKRLDLIALSRAAVARSRPPFPPEAPPAPEVPTGALVIVGGGGMPDGLFTRFVELAGGPEAKIVYLPCEEAEVIAREPSIVALFRKAGVKQATWRHTKDRAKANADEEFLAPLREATGIWFGGGRQWNLVDSYQNTTVHKLIHDVLARGGVVGGSSAGASIQGDYMPRGDPLGNLNIIAEGYETGLGLLTGVAIDQHFTQRMRAPDMTQLTKTYPQLLGIGIDEATAIVVQKNIAEVVGKNRVAFYDAKRPREDCEKDHVSLKAGDRYDLKARAILEPDAK